MIKDWVEKKVRRHLMRARIAKASAGSGGVGNGSTSSSGLFNDYQVRRHSQRAKARSSPIGP